MQTNTQTIQEKIANSKGLYFEILFNDLFLKSEKFKKFFLKEISKKISTKFHKNSSKILQWKNENGEQRKPFDFELDIKHDNSSYKFLIDIKYRSDNKFIENELKPLVKSINNDCLSKGIKCFLVFVVWSPNFYSINPRKSNFVSMKIILSKYNKLLNN